MAFVEKVDVEGFSGPELQHILTNTPHRSKLITKTTCSMLNIYNGLGSSVYHLSNSCGSKSLSVLAQNYAVIF